MFGDWHRSELDLESDCCELSLHLCSQARFWLLKKVPEELLGPATAAIRPNLSFLQRSRWIFYPAKKQVNILFCKGAGEWIYYPAKKQVNILFCKEAGEYIILQRNRRIYCPAKVNRWPYEADNLVFQILGLLHHHLVNHLLPADNWGWNQLSAESRFLHLWKGHVILETNLNISDQPAHVFVLTAALQPEVLYPPIGEVVRKSNDAPAQLANKKRQKNLLR